MHNSTLFDWNNLQYFTLLVEHETLTATAEVLGVQHSTVARRIGELEQGLGISLFDRIGKRYLLTHDGRQVYQYASELAKDIKGLQRFAEQASSLNVRVTVSAPPVVAKALLAPTLAKFYEKHKNITLIIDSNKQTSDLHHKQADIALRLVYPNRPDLVVRRLRTLSFGFFARPDYLANTPAKARRYLTLHDRSALSAWSEGLIGEQDLSLGSNEFDVIKQAALDGLGVGLLPSLYTIGTPLAATGIDGKPVAEATLEKTLYLVMHQDIRQSAAVSAVVEFLVGVLGE